MRSSVIFVTIGLACILSGAVAEDRHIIPTLKVEGTHYEVGRQIGAHFAEQIKSRVSADKKLQGLLDYIRQDDIGKQHYEGLLGAAKERYPEYVDEISGMSEGSGEDFDLLVLLNIRAEVSILRGKEEDAKESAQHCSDIMLLDSDSAIVGHNEDDPKGSDGYLVTARVVASHTHSPLMTHTAYILPGELATSAFGFNSFGFAFSQNALYSMDVNPNGLGRNFVSRHLLTARNIFEAMEIIAQDKIAIGHNYNLMDVHRRAIVNVETAPGVEGDRFVTRYASQSVVGALFHANIYHFKKQLNVTEPDETSSYHREAAAAKLPVAKDRAGILRILGDHTDEDFPIFRRAHAPDTGYTITTAVFDLDAKAVDLYTRNPHDHPNDFITVNLIDPSATTDGIESLRRSRA